MTQMTQMDERDPRTYAILGAAMEVHSLLGPGYLEAVYHRALERELALRGIPFGSEVQFQIWYKDEPLDACYKPDLLCLGEVLVELQANRQTSEADGAQVINYLKTTRLATGLLLNFGEPKLVYKRYVLSQDVSAPSASSAARKVRVG